MNIFVNLDISGVKQMRTVRRIFKTGNSTGNLSELYRITAIGIHFPKLRITRFR